MRSPWSAALLPLSGLFRAAVRGRNAGFRAGLFDARRVDGVKVISVGALRAGGSGKSPVAAFVARSLQARGVSTALVLRGYRGAMERRGGLVSFGQGPLVQPREAGDEAFAAASSLRGVAIRVGANRVAQTTEAAANGARAVVLDDGFQHRRLYRDLDILLVCPEDLRPGTAMLPAGPLREPASAARRAHLVAGLADDWRDIDGAPPILFEYACVGLVDRQGRVHPIAGAKVGLLAGIARPERFAATARHAGFEVRAAAFFPDHHRFTRAEVAAEERRARADGARLLLTTEKDLPRLVEIPTTLPLFALRIEATPVAGGDILEERLAAMGV